MRYVRMLSLSLKAHVAERGEEASAEVVDLWREPKKGPVQPERYSRPEKPDKVKKRKRLLVPRSEIPWFPSRHQARSAQRMRRLQGSL